MIVVSNKEINSILNTILHKAVTSIDSNSVCFIKSNYSDWTLEFYGTTGKTFATKSYKPYELIFDIKRYIKERGLSEFVKIELVRAHENYALLKINHENITEEEFDKYITLCKLYGFC